MPEKKKGKKKELPKIKVITCKTCGVVIAKFRRSAYPKNHVPAEKILSKIRTHYKARHPKKFREGIKKGVAKRKAKK